MSFPAFNFDDRLVEGLSSMGFANATPIQQLAIPAIMQGKDLIACAQTGTGKTAAYLLPILNAIVHQEHRHLNTLIIAPTRELVQQIDQQIEGFGYFLDVSSIAIYGGGDGASWDQQKRAMVEGADLVIATPGRLISILATGAINFDYLQHLVLDEADRMLDMGFYDDIVRIISQLPAKRQTLLFSATMPSRIRTLASKILTTPEEINIAVSKPADGITQAAYSVYDSQKTELLQNILHDDKHGSVLIFASTKETVKKLHNTLRKMQLNVKAIHSDLEQKEREEILRDFKNKQLPVLIGTDVLSRGIDVDGIGLVINYDVPPDPEDYIHRIGRTARAATTGVGITFINEKDQRRFSTIERLIGSPIEKLSLPESLGDGPAYSPGEHRNNPKRTGNQWKNKRRKKSRRN